jgi:hypothetical protein
MTSFFQITTAIAITGGRTVSHSINYFLVFILK